MTRIDYRVIDRAQRYYAERDFKLIDVPWIVSKEAVGFTLPDGHKAHELTDGRCLVGSAEQSFIQLIMDNFDELANWFVGRYQACTPCFRFEPEYDNIHLPHFMKVELFDNADPNVYTLDEIIDTAYDFFTMFIDAEIVKTSEGWDILCAQTGTELGSYGIRNIGKYGLYIYGTGLAEPRFSYVHQYQSASVY